MSFLDSFGWSEHFSSYFSEVQHKGVDPGRVLSEHRGTVSVITETGETAARVSGRLRHEATRRSDLPAVGDWVALGRRDEDGLALIHNVLPRKSSFSRKAAGTRIEEQVVAANIDVVFLVMGLDGDFNPRRLERYLTVAWQSGALPVVVFNKVDVCCDLEAKLSSTRSITTGADIEVVSAKTDATLAPLERHLKVGQTAALLGSSGAGKSTIINRLAGSEIRKTGGIRATDDRGKHTTTARELVIMPSGALLIDTPGMRELHMWDGDGLDSSFQDVVQVSRQCRFGDCSHTNEPGCAVLAAIGNGGLSEERLQSYRRLHREVAHLARKQDVQLQQQEKARWKAIHKRMRNVDKRR